MVPRKPSGEYCWKDVLIWFHVVVVTSGVPFSRRTFTASALSAGLFAAHLSIADSIEGTVPCLSATEPMTSGVTSCLRTSKAACLSGQDFEMPKPDPWMTARG